ncbi:MAG: 16S rRNA (guanine(966)-N(2))-methyltransferase RsmD [Pseudomonadales bacterium]|nr:16S rRNA (guanine(966)-N(2))-methyltransferase RsmD [Pseudomonadales bacterium]
MARRSKPTGTKEERSEVRIIAGKWRGRRIGFVAEPGLRPTPERVRETLFNWLQPLIPGSRCLDLFCGSGALAIEALSRGASSVTMIDSSATVLREVRANLERLGENGAATLVRAEACDWLQSTREAAYDIVFLDPPFNSKLAPQCLQLLDRATLLAPCARVYLESAIDEPTPVPGPGWVLHRERFAGNVAYRLFITPPPDPTRTATYL